ncbi:MAG: HAD-IIB family hydrolase [Actinomycetaceae bacterium]|nr:HAD-IIB family hydrolase [Actinomycetaceae bacterium]
MPTKLVAFDLDDTLAPSKSALLPENVRALAKLLGVCEVAVISGGDLPQFEAQLLAHLPVPPQKLGRLHILPTCGTKYLRYEDDGWHLLYAQELPADLAQRARYVLEKCARKLSLWEERTWGPRIENRGTQITFSALGQNAPGAEKLKWDPTGEKKNRLRELVQEQLPTLEVRSGGSTSVDITRRGIDKAYGMRKLMEATGMGPEEIIFVGDRLDPAGNDYPVIATGVKCIAVAAPSETPAVIRQIIAEIVGV